MCDQSDLQATGPRDKVYGCLALTTAILTNGLKLMENWCTWPVEFVYAITTVTLLSLQRSFFGFCFTPKRAQEDTTVLSWWLVDLSEGKTIIDILPSLSLDLSRPSNKTSCLFGHFSCTSGTESFYMKHDYPLLLTQGIFFDEVTACHSVDADVWSERDAPWTHISTMRSVHASWRNFLGLDLDQKSHTAHVGGGSVESAYWRTVVADLCLDEDFQQRRFLSREIREFVE